jgi:hypothetical protein
MSLPQNEYYPDDPEQLPPARRRRARRLLAPLEADERAETLDHLARRTSPTFDFFLFSLLAGFVLGLGLLLDLPALLVLGAVVAPLMAPVVGVALGTVLGSGKFFFGNLAGLLIGSLLVFAAGVIVGIISRIWLPQGLVQASLNAQLSWTNFLLLAVGAIFTSITMANPGRNPAASSVALAYTLYLPLVVAGFGLGSGLPHLWPDGLVVFAVYLSWAALIGALALAIVGFRPLTLFGYTLGGVVTLLGVILLIGFSGISAVLGAFGQPMALPTPIPTATATVTPIPPTATLTTTPVPPTVTPTRTLTPTSTHSPTPSPTLTPVPVYALVDAAFGDGANLRAEPRLDSALVITLLNGTLVQIIPESQIEVDGSSWIYVIVVETGTEGWMLQSVLLVATPAPDW